MNTKIQKPLKRLNNQEFAEDIKKYIRHTQDFYETKTPEMKILAKRLHQEYKLKDFYRVFNKFWNSGYHSEKALAIRTLNQYKDEFKEETWEFIKPKIQELKGWEEIDSVAANIVGYISIKVPNVRQELKNYLIGNDLWLKRLAIVSFVPIIKSGKIEPALRVIKDYLNTKDEPIQKACGILLREIGEQNPEILKKFILDNINMPKLTFKIATENRSDLRVLREPNKQNNGFERLMFWKN